MIVKISPKRGSHMTGLVRYLFGRGERNEHHDPHLITGSAGIGIADGWRPASDRTRSRELAALSRYLDWPRRIGSPFPGGHVWHCSLSNRPGDRPLTDAEWAEAAHLLAERMGFTATADGRSPARWAAIAHGPSRAGAAHIHIVADLVREDGTPVNIWHDRNRLSRLANELERRYELTIVQGRHGAGLPGYTHEEAETAVKRHHSAPDRLLLAREARAASVAAADEAEFVRRLTSLGLLVRPRIARGEVTGYALALPPPDPSELPIWFAGASLAPDLTLPRLREAWNRDTDSASAAREAWRGRSVAGREAITVRPQAWPQAAARIAKAAEHLQTVPAEDHATWAGAAREVAGAYAALSLKHEVARFGPFARASRALSYCAQSHPGQVHADRSGPGVRDLRGTVMVILQGWPGEGNQRAQMMLLLAQLQRVTRLIMTAAEQRGDRDRAERLADRALVSLLAAPSTGTAAAPATQMPPAPARRPQSPDRGR